MKVDPLIKQKKNICIPQGILLFFFLYMTPLYIEAADPTITLSNSLEEGIEKEYSLKLSYQNKQNDFLIFYDQNGETIYIQYRRDKWDYRREKMVKELQRANEYNIRFIYLGTLNEMDHRFKDQILPFKLTKEEIQKALPQRVIREIPPIKVGRLIDLQYSHLDDLRLE